MALTGSPIAASAANAQPMVAGAMHARAIQHAMNGAAMAAVAKADLVKNDAVTRDAAKAAAVMRDMAIPAVRISVMGKTVAAKAGHRVVRAVRALPLLTPDVLAQYAALHADQLRA